MRAPSASVPATQNQSTQAENHSQAWPEHPAEQFLRLLGKDPKQTYFRTIRPGKGANGSRGGKDLHGFDLQALTRDSQAGESIYYVTGNSNGPRGLGVKAKDVISCPALFAEWDDRPMDWQLRAWQELGLPEPTIQLLTGGKSVHCYWLLDKPMAPEQWRPLQARLIDHCQSDTACKDPSRVMRLPGFNYIDKLTGKPTSTAELIHCGGSIWTAAEIEECLPPVVEPTARATATSAPPPTRTLLHGPPPPTAVTAVCAGALQRGRQDHMGGAVGGA